MRDATDVGRMPDLSGKESDTARGSPERIRRTLPADTLHRKAKSNQPRLDRLCFDLQSNPRSMDAVWRAGARGADFKIRGGGRFGRAIDAK